jgi:hypothetical protein
VWRLGNSPGDRRHVCQARHRDRRAYILGVAERCRPSPCRTFWTSSTCPSRSPTRLC